MNAMERIEVDNKDRPIEDIVVLAAQVFVDPYEEADEQLAKEREAEKERIAKEAAEKRAPRKKEGDQNLKVYREGVGKYLNTNVLGQK